MKYSLPTTISLSVLSLSMAAEPESAPPAPLLKEIVVTGSPLGRTLNEQTQPVTVLTGRELAEQMQPTLGETLSQTPGVSSTYFGPASSRPIIRGLGEDRIRILSNGVSSADVSNVSPDHALTLDPLVLNKIEVVRGPATLLYGPNGVGGVVNVLDGRIPEEKVTDGLFGLPIRGSVESRYGSAEELWSGGGYVDIGLGPIVIHFDAFARESQDIAIPGNARSATLRRLEPLGPGEKEESGRLANSANKTSGGALGASYIWDSGFFGVAYSLFDADYGTVAEKEVTIAMEQRRWEARGAFYEPFAGVKSIAYKFGYSDYEHTEFEGAETGTLFQIEGYNGRIDLVHETLGNFDGAIGYETAHTDFSALGAEAFLPPVETNLNSLFLFEELPVGDHRWQFGLRYDHTSVDSDSNAGFGRGRSLTFDAVSAATGFVWTLPSDYTVALQASFTQRAPTYVELLANGPHVATNAFEIGDPNLGLEKSFGLDLSLRKTRGFVTGGVSLFYNHFNNYIAQIPTGGVVESDEEPGESMPIYEYRATDADFFGGEVEATFHLLGPKTVAETPSVGKGVIGKNPAAPVVATGSSSTLDLEWKADYVMTRDRDNGGSLPRIPPFRTSAALVYEHGKIAARLEGQFVAHQGRTADEELGTESYFLLNAGVSYRLLEGPVNLDVFVRGTNLTDEEARVHSSFLKDIAPLAGRGVTVGLKASF